MANHPPLNRTRKMVNSDSPPPICFSVPFFLMHWHLIFSGLLPGTKCDPNWTVGTGSELIQFGNTAPPPVLLGPPGEPGPARVAEMLHVLPWTRRAGPWKGDSEGPPYLPFVSHSETHSQVCLDTGAWKVSNVILWSLLEWQKRRFYFFPFLSLKYTLTYALGLLCSLFFSVGLCFPVFSSKPRMEIDQDPDAFWITSRANKELHS